MDSYKFLSIMEAHPSSWDKAWQLLFNVENNIQFKYHRKKNNRPTFYFSINQPGRSPFSSFPIRNITKIIGLCFKYSLPKENVTVDFNDWQEHFSDFVGGSVELEEGSNASITRKRIHDIISKCQAAIKEYELTEDEEFIKKREAVMDEYYEEEFLPIFSLIQQTATYPEEGRMIVEYLFSSVTGGVLKDKPNVSRKSLDRIRKRMVDFNEKHGVDIPKMYDRMLVQRIMEM